MALHRREFIKNAAMGTLCLGTSLPSLAAPLFSYRGLKDLSALGAPDALGLRLPTGFKGRLLAQGGQGVQTVSGAVTPYVWHVAADGGACYDLADGGWIYTSNSEIALGGGGAGALRFDALGRVVDAYSILKGTSMNCAGGKTPWQTWLSCEETSQGQVYECDIFGTTAAVVRRGLGTFKHEAVAIDTQRMQAYLTEDEKDGGFYRYTPSSVVDGRMNLDEGLLEIAIVDTAGGVTWAKLEDPNPGIFSTPTRKQIAGRQIFNGGEGIWYHEGTVHFSTKGDNRVWSYDTITQMLTVIYDQQTSTNPMLSGVDNIVVSNDGHILVAEDGGDMQIVVLGPYGDIYPLLQVTGQDGSEITGPAISPNSGHLYFSSQRGKILGLTYGIEGPFA